jgi:tRNA U55 pseudouridine synthase TruB
LKDKLKLRLALKLVCVVPSQDLITKAAHFTSSAAVHNVVSKLSGTNVGPTGEIDPLVLAILIAENKGSI